MLGTLPDLRSSAACFKSLIGIKIYVARRLEIYIPIPMIRDNINTIANPNATSTIFLSVDSGPILLAINGICPLPYTVSPVPYEFT